MLLNSESNESISGLRSAKLPLMFSLLFEKYITADCL